MNMHGSNTFAARSTDAGVKRRLLESYLQARAAGQSNKNSVITRRPPEEPAPLSLSQEQLWLREQAHEGMPATCNECITIKSKVQFEQRHIERALAEIIRQHESWRTTYAVENGMPIQVIHPAPENFELLTFDLRRHPTRQRETKLASITSEMVSEPFDLARGPLLRGALLRFDETDHRLFLCGHLSILDGISVYQILPLELATLYKALSEDREHDTAELPIQYTDYAYWQRRFIAGTEHARQLAYWREQLSGLIPPPLWSGRKPRVNDVPRGEIHSFALSDSTAAALDRTSRIRGVTLFTVLLTTFATLLHHYTGQRDLAVATLAPSGRKRPEVQRLLGYFLNPVVLRVDFTGDPPFSEMLTRTQRIIANALCHDDLPLAAIRQDSTVDSMCGALAPIALSLQPRTPPLETDWEVTSMDANSGGSIWELYLAFIQRDAGLIGRAQYNPDVFDTSAVANILTDLETLLQGATANPAQRISTLLSRMRQMTT
jgi:hypothetical protein